MSEFDLGAGITDGMKKLMLAGIGAMAVTAERTKEVVDDLVAAGELTVEQGTALAEEAKKQAVDHAVKAADAGTDIAEQLVYLSADQLDRVRAKLAEIDKANGTAE